MRKLAVWGLLVGAAFALASAPADAQKINQKSLDKTRWYSAPREFQIIDERPIIRDFREAPQAEQSIELPPAPTGFGGGGGGGGGGAMGGPAPSMPAGGMQLGGPNQGFRSAPAGLGSLPKSGFGGTNIPARGMGPRGALPSGSSTNRLMGKMMPQGNGASGGAPRGMSPSAGRSSGNYSGPAVSSYSGGYGSGSGSASGGSASRTDTSVRGTLLRSK